MWNDNSSQKRTSLFYIWEKGGEISVLGLDVRIYIDARINQIIWGAIALSLIYLR